MDVTHEVRPVTSGCRFVLTYNLIYTAQGSVQFAADLADDTIRLQNILSLWNTSFQGPEATSPKILAYMPCHKYTDANLNYVLLKGRDQQTVHSLLEACRKEDFCFFLANLVREVSGDCNMVIECDMDGQHQECYDDDGRFKIHAIEGQHDQKVYLSKVIDPHGSVIGTDMTIDEENNVQKDPFARAPDKEDCTGDTVTQIHRNTVSDEIATEFSAIYTDSLGCNSDAKGLPNKICISRSRERPGRC